MNLSAQKPATSACPLCATSAQSDAGYFERAFAEPHQFAITSEAITETFGFCRQHERSLLCQNHLSESVARVLRAALPRLLLLLNEDFLHETPVQQILFAAGNACPACSSANCAVGRQAAKLARLEAEAGAEQQLCFNHFQRVAANQPPERRLQTLTRYATSLEEVARSVRNSQRRLPHDETRMIDGETMASFTAALHLTTGHTAFEATIAEQNLSSVLRPTPRLDEAIAIPDSCPLCIETTHASQRWLQNAQRAADFEQDAWLFFPTCPEHIGMIARLGRTELTLSVLARALAAQQRYLRQQIHVLVVTAELAAEHARIKAEGPEVWLAYKRKLARQKVEIPRIPVPRLAKCPACERIEIATEHAIGKLLDLLCEKRHRDAYRRGYGLCMKHFARVYPMAPKGKVRSLLAEDQRDRLNNLMRHLDENTSDVVWATALHRFCG